MEDRKLICIDLDGTLLNKSGTVSKENIDAINKVRALGHVVCIVTGRPWRSTAKVYKDVGLDTMVGNYNGALIHHPLDKSIKSREFKVRGKIMEEILSDRTLKKRCHSFILENKGHVYISHPDTSAIAQYAIEDANTHYIGDGLHEYLKNDVTGCLILVKKRYDALVFKSHLMHRFGHIVNINHWIEAREGIVLDVVNKLASKGYALKSFAHHYHIDWFNTIAIGDAWNDTSMLLEAGHGVAMANASEEVKQCANEEMPWTNDESGVGKWLTRHFNLK